MKNGLFILPACNNSVMKSCHTEEKVHNPGKYAKILVSTALYFYWNFLCPDYKLVIKKGHIDIAHK
ncbi:hypothetical protein HOLleu_35918 [Holothuria leucospilota]|uniref:Uncharacterized protein n=1 Tax=Holothuria leucospilota TaxID=206669 RepID=A0A9Q1BEA9_HOLLE|nr:hypothetical protein HOLleu_35918 [Holothuria leucospilota]